MSLADVVGQSQVTDVLSSALKAGKIGHAYLFIGPRGTGKTSVARIFAHEVNGFKYELEDDYVDIIEIDGASNRGIDNIRELREKAMIAPTKGKYKIYIIDEVHMLTKEAFNALLKTLEEPPEHVIFIMATTDAYKVPITITSRSQSFTFKLADSETMSNYLRKVADKEKIKISDAAIRIIVKRGGGSFRDTLSLLDQISTLSSDEITEQDVIAALGLPEDEKITILLENYQNGDLDGVSVALRELFLSGIKPETLTEELINAVVANPKPNLLPLLDALVEIKPPFAEARLLVALSNVAKQSPVKNRPSVATVRKSVALEKEVPVPPARKSALVKKEVPVPPAPNKDFNWDGFKDKVRDMNDAIYSQLLKVGYEFSNNQLEIYPTIRIAKNILSKTNNVRILSEAAGGVKVTIHEVGEKSAEKDAVLAKFSAIMGGEVKNDTGGNPFQ